MNKSRLIRERQAEAASAIERSGANIDDGSPSVLVQTVTVSTYPTTASSFFACQPILVDGPETEGAAASFTPDPARVLYAYNLGTQIPPTSTRLILTCCGGRWVFRYDG